jgi:hypothetical protein
MGRYKYLILLTALIYSCKVAYQPSVTTVPNHYLVVEGVINSGTDSTTFKLSRTVNISSTKAPPAELNAQVSVEDENGYSYILKETGQGNYTAGSLGLDNSKLYRLRIKTSDGKVYLSDLVPVVTNPPVDSVNYTTDNNILQLYVNTHNPANNTRYYRWEFAETWMYTSFYNSLYVTNGSQIVLRTPGQQVHNCWSSDVSNNIILASSAQLTQDVISLLPITQISPNSDKIAVEYSILVKQYGLTKDAFTFWQLLKKNTEQLGSIFDALPSQVTGNIHCLTVPSEPVLGYISVTNVQSQRVFINRFKGESPSGQFPQSWIPPAYPYPCVDDNGPVTITGPAAIQQYLIPLNSYLVPIDIKTDLGSPGVPPVIGYTSASQQCTDCTIRGGTNKQPAFWK